MRFEHGFRVQLEWTGDLGRGTADARAYSREHVLRAEGHHEIRGSADRVFHGDAALWNPEQMLLGALSQCHLLAYLYEAAANGVVVVGYTDDATATLKTEADGSGAVTEAVLRPVVTIAAGDPGLAQRLHDSAKSKCFIANSVAFPVRHEPVVLLADDPLS
ncbi:OsmC family protein [Schumannella luteola]|uniref:Organic hydroperoxide reductase OsmC/OhrA n=1 Tax=Schumannella luteola TaxID=472059 RepID=A0A852YEG1_9MICO|nr:OsmC family protein [Schumannella luteola]NYG99690.1 organic hydroperoxide reductase OsmC/OhrA [Schumannella luteola]TPX04873.1 OsmC family peroxiredoxin [Schumannella luteola]